MSKLFFLTSELNLAPFRDLKSAMVSVKHEYEGGSCKYYIETKYEYKRNPEASSIYIGGGIVW